MDVLIIGGTGLISTAISRQLLDAGHSVTLYNRGKTASRIPGGAKHITGDRKDFAAFEKQFEDARYDVVVDMVAFQPEDTESAIRAFKGKTGQFIHCSTVCVYSGPPEQIPTTETEPYHSLGGYGKNKAACEQLLLTAHAADGFPATIMRPSHSYGEGGDVIRPFGPSSSFVDRLRKGKQIIVHGDGTSLWASCHVDDVGRGFINTMGNPKCIGQAYNITGDEWMTWNTYHEQVAEVVGGEFKPVYIPTAVLRDAAPGWAGGTWEIFAWPSVFDNGKIVRDAGYTGQTVNFKQGTARTVAWLEENNRIVSSDEHAFEDELIGFWETQTAALPKMG